CARDANQLYYGHAMDYW
nr:immunoglobulin heavy chain junction region [Mus musculus]